MESHAPKCVERYFGSAKKDVSSLQQAATPCIDDHQIPPEDYATTRELFLCFCHELDDQIYYGQ